MYEYCLTNVSEDVYCTHCTVKTKEFCLFWSINLVQFVPKTEQYKSNRLFIQFNWRQLCSNISITQRFLNFDSIEKVFETKSFQKDAGMLRLLFCLLHFYIFRWVHFRKFSFHCLQFDELYFNDKNNSGKINENVHLKRSLVF